MKGKSKQKGPPFISDPGVLVFRDFVVGEEFELPFTLTNVSFGRNTYQVQGFDKEHESLFELKYSPPGYVSPGIPINLTLIFKPKFNSPIKTSIHFLTEACPFEVQVECYPKKIDIAIEPFDEFNLGTVTLGEEIESSLTLRNSGALSSIWSISLEEIRGIESIPLQEAEDGILSFSLRHGTINGYSNSVIKATFRPNAPGSLHYTLKIKFSAPGNEYQPFYKEIPIKALCVDVPVYLETDRIDFGVCYYKELYRASLTAHNRSNLSQRFVINMPPNLDQFLEFMPKMGFIQPLSSLQITAKLRTSSAFHSLFPQYEQTVDIPIVLEVANQVLPVNFSVSFTPSSTRIVIDPPSLDFGTFLTTETREVPLRLTSNLQLPINFGFVRLPQGVTVQPFDGFGLIQPNETIEVKVSFQSQIPKKHTFTICLATLQGTQYNISATANVVTPPIIFNATDVTFEATPLGDESSFKLMVQNTRGQPMEIEMETPEDFFFDPVVMTIPPITTMPLFLTFKPSIPLFTPETKSEEVTDQVVKPSTDKSKSKGKHSAKGHHKKEKKEDSQVEDLVKSEFISPDFTFKQYEESIACFWRCGSQTGRHHLMLHAAAVLPTVFVTSVIINKKERKSDEMIDLSLNRIDFGVVATGQQCDALIEVKSVLRKPVTLEYEYECGSFEVLSPIIQLKCLQTGQIRIRFCPMVHMKFSSTVVIRCVERPNTRITLHLTGEGAAPSISLSQESLDFGHSVVGHTVTRSVQVKNNASFALKYIYSLKPEKSDHCHNISGSEAFKIVRRSQWLQPGETGEAKVSFTPDHDDLTWQNTLIISAGEEGESREVPINACSWPYPMFIIGGNEEERQRTAFDHYLLDEPYFRPNVICEMAYPGNSTVVLTIGVASQSDDIKKSNGDFTFDNFSVPGFTVTPMKSGVESGGVTKVAIEYNPPASSLLQVGQWVVAETFINLKCADFTRKVPIKLKCLINLQQAADLSQLASTRNTKSQPRRQRNHK